MHKAREHNMASWIQVIPRIPQKQSASMQQAVGVSVIPVIVNKCPLRGEHSSRSVKDIRGSIACIQPGCHRTVRRIKPVPTAPIREPALYQGARAGEITPDRSRASSIKIPTNTHCARRGESIRRPPDLDQSILSHSTLVVEPVPATVYISPRRNSDCSVGQTPAPKTSPFLG